MNYIEEFLKQFSKAITRAIIKSSVVIVGVGIIISLIIVVALIFGEKYQFGRDTIESFGSGRYQIVRFPLFEKKEGIYNMIGEYFHYKM